MTAVKELRSRRIFVAATALVMAIGTPASAQDPAAGYYRLTGVHDAAGELLLREDGSFEYALAYGALDERAAGTWTRQGRGLALTTVPKPVPPTFRMEARGASGPDAPTLRVTWPDGSGIAGIDFRIGFASGDPVAGYTQGIGWTISPAETRKPLWIELYEPIHGIASGRYPVDGAASGTLHFVLVPNDIGVVDFEGVPVEASADQLVIHRGGGEMRFSREGRK